MLSVWYTWAYIPLFPTEASSLLIILSLLIWQHLLQMCYGIVSQGAFCSGVWSTVSAKCIGPWTIPRECTFTWTIHALMLLVRSLLWLSFTKCKHSVLLTFFSKNSCVMLICCTLKLYQLERHRIWGRGGGNGWSFHLKSIWLRDANTYVIFNLHVMKMCLVTLVSWLSLLPCGKALKNGWFHLLLLAPLTEIVIIWGLSKGLF